MPKVTYPLNGPKEFVYPFPVLYANEIVAQQSPGTIVPPSEYRVIGAGPESQSATIQWPQAPVNGNSDLILARYVDEDRVANFTQNGVDARSLDFEFNHIYDLLQEAKAITQTLIVPAGGWDPRIGHFPSNADEGDIFYVTHSGTVDGISFDLGDRLIALVPNPDPNTYAGNWVKTSVSDGLVAGDPNTLLANAANYISAGAGNAQLQNTAGYLTSLGSIPHADTNTFGTVQRATDAQAAAGTNNTLYVTPAHLAEGGGTGRVLLTSTQTFVAPITATYTFRVVGGGGRGGSCHNQFSTAYMGTGGGGSGQCRLYQSQFNKGDNISVTVGGSETNSSVGGVGSASAGENGEDVDEPGGQQSAPTLGKPGSFFAPGFAPAADFNSVGYAQGANGVQALGTVQAGDGSAGGQGGAGRGAGGAGVPIQQVGSNETETGGAGAPGCVYIEW